MINEIVEDIGSGKIKTKEEFIDILYSYIDGDRLNSVIKDFYNYRNKNRKNIENKYTKLFKQLSFFFLLLEDINRFVELFFQNNDNKNEIKYRINVCTKLYNKSLQAFIDIFGLLENGSIGSTYLLWRSIYENYVIVLYLITGPEEESNLFNEYAIIQEKKLFNKTFTQEEHKKYTEKFGKDYKKDYCWAKRITKVKSFKNIVNYVKEDKFYPFYMLSTYIGHSSSFSVNRKIFSQDNIANIQMIGFFPDEVTHSLNILLSTLSEFSKLILKHFVDKEQRIVIESLIDYFGIIIDENRKK